MTHYQTLYRDKILSRRDWLTAKMYGKIRYCLLRSKAINDSLHLSNIERLHLVKGITYDSLESPVLERFWKELESYFKNDSLPIIKLLDSLTGFYYPSLKMEPDLAKFILKKLRRVLKQVDLMALFSDIDGNMNLKSA